jgi:hypothetical protein
MPRARHLAVALGFVLAGYSVFEYSQRDRISGCEESSWQPQAETFNRDLWERRDHRERQVVAIRRQLEGASRKEVESLLGPARRVYRGIPLRYEYELGRLRFLTCMIDVNALLSVEIDSAGRVTNVAGYVD